MPPDTRSADLRHGLTNNIVVNQQFTGCRARSAGRYTRAAENTCRGHLGLRATDNAVVDDQLIGCGG